jgi:hypothetical protein
MSQIALIIVERNNFSELEVRDFISTLVDRKSYLYFVCSESYQSHQRFVNAAEDLNIYNTDESLKYEDISDGEWGFRKVIVFNRPKSLDQAA